MAKGEIVLFSFCHYVFNNLLLRMHQTVSVSGKGYSWKLQLTRYSWSGCFSRKSPKISSQYLDILYCWCLLKRIIGYHYFNIEYLNVGGLPCSKEKLIIFRIFIFSLGNLIWSVVKPFSTCKYILRHLQQITMENSVQK